MTAMIQTWEMQNFPLPQCSESFFSQILHCKGDSFSTFKLGNSEP